MSEQKITWIVFGLLIFLNIPFFILGIMDIFDGWPLYLIPLFQIGWLYSLANHAGMDVFGKSSEFIASPNFWGQIFIIIGSSISLVVNYFIARFITKLFFTNP